jgi:hypothetical protein
MLTVLLLLVWWRQGEVKEVASEEWVAAVRDVAWVLKGLLSVANNKYDIPLFTRFDSANDHRSCAEQET